MKNTAIKYALRESAVSLCATIVICTILFCLMPSGGVALPSLAGELAIGAGCTGLVCAAIQFFTRRAAVKKGSVPPMGEVGAQASYALMPKNAVAFIAVVTVECVLLFACAPVGALSAVAPGFNATGFALALFKAVLTGFAAGYASFHGTVFFSAMFQHKIA